MCDKNTASGNGDLLLPFIVCRESTMQNKMCKKYPICFLILFIVCLLFMLLLFFVHSVNTFNLHFFHLQLGCFVLFSKLSVLSHHCLIIQNFSTFFALCSAFKAVLISLTSSPLFLSTHNLLLLPFSAPESHASLA